MQRFTVLIGICSLLILASGGMLVRTIVRLTPDRPAGGPPALPAVMQRAQQEQQVIERKTDVVVKKQELTDFKLTDCISKFQIHDRQFSEAIDELEAKLKTTQAPLRSAAQKLNTAYVQLAQYRAVFEAHQRMAEQGGAGGVSGPESPEWNPASMNNAETARGEFEIAFTTFEDSVEQARVAGNQHLSSLQLQVLSTLDGLAGIQTEALTNQTEMLQLYDQLIKFVNKFGRLGSGPVALPPGVEPGKFTGEHFRSLMQAMGERVRDGMTADAVTEKAKENVRRDAVIQRAIQIYKKGLND